jgi:phospholipid transport system substrate-binding protein
MELPNLRKGVLLSVIVGLLGLVPVLSAEAGEGLSEPQVVIQDISDQLKSLLHRDRERLRNDPEYAYRLANEVLAPHIDFGRVSALVLGKHWQRANAAQRAEFTEQFKRLLVRTYATAFSEFKDWEIQHFPLQLRDGEEMAQVRIKVLRSGAQPVEVLYRMHHDDQGWKVFNVKIEGVSLVTNYRTNFNQEIRRGGIDGLIQTLKSKNEMRVKTAGLSKVADPFG